MPVSPSKVYLHIGPPKTGTTYLQDILDKNRRRLGSSGVAFPKRPIDHFRAALDLRGMRFGGFEDPRTEGAWARLADAVAHCRRPAAIVSHEILAGASERQAARAVQSLAPAAVHVVYAARDLGRLLPAVWQESLKNRRVRPYEAFVEQTLRQYGSDLERPHFWRSQDPVRTLQRWGTAVPSAHIHVLVVPPSRQPPDLLWVRFCQVLGISPEGFRLRVARVNRSLGFSEAEVLRRANAEIPEEVPWPRFERVVKDFFNRRAAHGSSTDDAIVVPDQHRAAVMAIADEIRAALADSPYDVVGDLAELVPAPSAFGPMPQPQSPMVAEAARNMRRLRHRLKRGFRPL
ncbi:MAG TPA: hypothetical protein VFI30_01635 [Nocardioidaceae bacterium]|nr:hypothetical protein [Nocardioidaceae bacterium]